MYALNSRFKIILKTVRKLRISLGLNTLIIIFPSLDLYPPPLTPIRLRPLKYRPELDLEPAPDQAPEAVFSAVSGDEPFSSLSWEK